MKQQETASLTSNPQPDVLSGLENVTISQHLENTDNNNGDVSPNMSKSSSSEFENWTMRLELVAFPPLPHRWGWS